MGSTNISHDVPMYTRLKLQGRVNLDGLIFRPISIANFNDAHAELKSGEIAQSVSMSF